ncbi:MAG: Nif3-like dinuclear metal center hexameric protein [Pseudomonadota bacterium]
MPLAGVEMPALAEIVAWCDQQLHPADVDDYCPNGLQVEACDQVRKIVSGVTASLDLIQAAVAQQADVLLVHHGYFWRGEPDSLTGMKGRRIRALMQNNLSLIAYHLPLDAHPTLGNNARLGVQLGLNGQPDAGHALLWGATLSAPLSTTELTEYLGQQLQRSPIVIDAKQPIRRLAWCTGAAQGMITQAAAAGYDAYLSGEISEQTQHQARELGITYFAAGHHATERYGVQALGAELASRFDLQHHFIDLDNPA